MLEGFSMFAISRTAAGWVLAFPVWGRGREFGMHTEDTFAGDLFVLAHLGFFFLLLGCFGWAAWSIWRRTTHPEPHLKLLMEMDQSLDASAVNPSAGTRSDFAEGMNSMDLPRDPWERPPEWWKS